MAARFNPGDYGYRAAARRKRVACGCGGYAIFDSATRQPPEARLMLEAELRTGPWMRRTLDAIVSRLGL